MSEIHDATVTADAEQLLATLAGDMNADQQGLAERLMATLVRAYAQPPRFYHTFEHARDVALLVDGFDGDGQERLAIRLAAWFHDAVYDPRRSDNEERSADFFEQTFGAYVAKECLANVRRLILMTRDHLRAADRLERALADADLAIFAANKDVYQRYAANIRREYSFVADDIFCAGRLAFLRKTQAHIAEHGRLFFALDAQCERRAAENISAEIARLLAPDTS